MSASDSILGQSQLVILNRSGAVVAADLAAVTEIRGPIGESIKILDVGGRIGCWAAATIGIRPEGHFHPVRAEVPVGVTLKGVRSGIIGIDEGSGIALGSIAQAVPVGVGIGRIGAGIGGIHEGSGPGLGPVYNPVIVAIGISGIREGIEFFKISGAIVIEVIGS